jgi:hypothetical protein
MAFIEAVAWLNDIDLARVDAALAFALGVAS